MPSRAASRISPNTNEIAERGAGEACQIGGFAGPQSVDKSAGGVADGRLLHAGVLHLGRQGRIDGDAAIGRKRDKALRKVDIARGQCGADFALRHIPIEAAVERLIADPDRIVGCSEPVSRGNAVANKRKRDQRQRGRRRRAQRPDAVPTEGIAARPSFRALALRGSLSNPRGICRRFAAFSQQIAIRNSLCWKSGRRPAMVRWRLRKPDSTPMTDTIVPHFHNDLGVAGHRDRRQGIHVRRRQAAVRPSARLLRHGRRCRIRLPVLLDALPPRSGAGAQRGAAGGMCLERTIPSEPRCAADGLAHRHRRRRRHRRT